MIVRRQADGSSAQSRRAGVKKSPHQAINATAIAAAVIFPASQISGWEGTAESDPIKIAAIVAAVTSDHLGIAPNRMVGRLADRMTIAVATEAPATAPEGERPATAAIVENAATIAS